jgi:nitroreductase
MKTRDLEKALAVRAAASAEWQPRLYHAADPAEGAALSALLDGDDPPRVVDEIRSQLAELAEIRAPHRKLDASATDAGIARELGGRPAWQYGVWVHYPWSARLVHLLPEAEYREVRTNRNRNKITLAEQERLRRAVIGIAGLSVGSATAVTLALEEVGGEFRLADFDTLALSNLNRLRASVGDLGVSKVVLTARTLYELNPFLRVQLFPEGATEENLDAFLEGLDLLFEECDDLRMKVRLRERARELRIPVLMETSDRGLFDLERFDLEPERPIFHGLAGDLRADELAGLSTYEKVPVVLSIIGATTMSARLAASLVDVEASLKSWPQLASSVALGGAVNTDAARRVLLGELEDSGRYFVDLNEIVRPGAAAATPARPVPRGGDEPAVAPPLPLIRRGGGPSDFQVTALVSHALLAPSGGNCQPWRFSWTKGRLEVFHDAARSRSFLDFGHGGAMLAIGAALENLALAAESLGFEAQVHAFPDKRDPSHVAGVRFAPAVARDQELGRWMAARATNRRRGPRQPLPDGTIEALAHAAEGARLQAHDSPEALDAIAGLLGRGERLRFLSQVMHAEMMREIRWTAGEARATRDGIDAATLELDATERAGLEVLRDARVLDALRGVGGGAGLEKLAHRSIESASAMGLLTIERTGPQSFLEGGRRLQRLWLRATSLGLALQPMTALIYLFARLERGGGEGLSAGEREELSLLRRGFREVFEVPRSHAELMLFRLARTGPPSARALRRPVHEVLVVEGNESSRRYEDGRRAL